MDQMEFFSSMPKEMKQMNEQISSLQARNL